MFPAFVIAGGTVAGRHHALSGRNDQDAFAWRQDERGLVAVVCDGCSSGAHSEAGAAIGCQLVAQAMAEQLGVQSLLEATERAQAKVLDALKRLAGAMSGAAPGTEAFTRVVAEHFLFTVVGVAVGPSRSRAFTLGDGLLAVNGSARNLGPFPGNAPPYLGYALCGPGAPRVAFDLRPLPPPEELASVVLATDGAADLDLQPFLEDPRVLANPDMVRRLLWMQGRAKTLEDDATLVVLRRAP
ncbi:MAG TPA: protein phosphatase 2C domain-containing protein [Myxococcales bacterium]